MNQDNFIVLTYKEWTNWVEYGHLKINIHRIKRYIGNFESFQDLLSVAPDITFSEDNEFIITRLIDNYFIHIFSLGDGINLYLPLNAVDGFYAVSTRGKAILDHQAQQLKVNLLIDENIDKNWDKWCALQKTFLMANKARTFCQVMFTDKIKKDCYNINTILEPFQSELSFNNNFIEYLEKFNRLIISHPDASKLEKYRDTKAYGGISTRVLVKDIIKGLPIEKQYDLVSEYCRYREYYASLQKIQFGQELKHSFLMEKSYNIIKEKITTENLFKDCGVNVPLLALSVYIHYEMLIISGKEIDLNSLKFDLNIIRHFSYNPTDNTHLLVTYMLGKLLPETMVSSLFYILNLESVNVLNKEIYTQLKVKLPRYDLSVFDQFATQSECEIEKLSKFISDSSSCENEVEVEVELSIFKKQKLENSLKQNNESTADMQILIDQPIILSNQVQNQPILSAMDMAKNSSPMKSQSEESQNKKLIACIANLLNTEEIKSNITWTILLKNLKKEGFQYDKNETFFDELKKICMPESEIFKKNLKSVLPIFKEYIENMNQNLSIIPHVN